jgi:tetratricopeptide (TPR) repeat protein
MSRILLLIIISFSINGLRAQSNLDSLYTVWQDPAQLDSSRIEAYNYYIGGGFIYSNPYSAFVLAEALQNYAQKHNYPKASALGYNLQGVSSGVQDNYPRALEYFYKSLTIYEEVGDKTTLTFSLVIIGSVYQKQRKTNLALNYCQRALTLAEEIKAFESEKHACQCLCDTYKAIGKGNDALVFLEKMQVIEDSLNAQETNRILQQMEFQKQVLADSIDTAEEAHQEEVRQGEKIRNIALGDGLILFILAGG